MDALATVFQASVCVPQRVVFREDERNEIDDVIAVARKAGFDGVPAIRREATSDGAVRYHILIPKKPDEV
jgi:hypothetical protein